MRLIAVQILKLAQAAAEAEVKKQPVRKWAGQLNVYVQDEVAAQEMKPVAPTHGRKYHLCCECPTVHARGRATNGPRVARAACVCGSNTRHQRVAAAVGFALHSCSPSLVSASALAAPSVAELVDDGIRRAARVRSSSPASCAPSRPSSGPTSWMLSSSATTFCSI
jgi:hypothetical protein